MHLRDIKHVPGLSIKKKPGPISPDLTINMQLARLAYLPSKLGIRHRDSHEAPIHIWQIPDHLFYQYEPHCY